MQPGPAERLTIFIGESDRYRHRPLHTEITERAQQAGLAGATVLRGIEGFGASSHLHTTRVLRLSEDLPVVVVIVDSPVRIDAFLAELGDLVTEGLVLREPVEVVSYQGRTG